ncbi:MAG: peroxiredoxin [Candidatus Diapherotrites archaeon]|nr:peroxiredoxin [Candidatus Diapherotrites archaeon]
MVLKVGELAPNFEGQVYFNGEFQKIKLSDYKGKWLVLFFYPLDFTFVCPTEIQGYNAKFAEFKKLNADVLGASVDSVHSHKAWVKQDLGELNYPLFADITKQVSREYGVLIENEGIALRGTFIVNPEGVLVYSVVHTKNVGRNTDEALRVLAALQTGELCPMDWAPGKKTLGKA